MTLRNSMGPVEAVAPAWMVTFGDMSCLLLCFFIFLLSTARFDVDKLVEASGYMSSRAGVLPEEMSLHPQKKAKEMEKGTGTTDRKHLDVEEGQKYAVGGKQAFATGSAALHAGDAGVNDTLIRVARMLRGHLNIIEVRGHAGADEPVPPPLRDAMDLSLERARAVRDFLVGTGGIPAERIRVTGCGTNEPRKSDRISAEAGENQRVEIRLTERFQYLNTDTKP